MVASQHDNCREVLQRLYHYLDGELTDESRADIQQHLEDCSPCVEAFGFEKDLRRVIAQRCRDVPPPDLRRRIAEALSRDRSA